MRHWKLAQTAPWDFAASFLHNTCLSFFLASQQITSEFAQHRVRTTHRSTMHYRKCIANLSISFCRTWADNRNYYPTWSRGVSQPHGQALLHTAAIQHCFGLTQLPLKSLQSIPGSITFTKCLQISSSNKQTRVHYTLSCLRRHEQPCTAQSAPEQWVWAQVTVAVTVSQQWAAAHQQSQCETHQNRWAQTHVAPSSPALHNIQVALSRTTAHLFSPFTKHDAQQAGNLSSQILSYYTIP